MKLEDTISLHAEAIALQDKTTTYRKLNPLLTVHLNAVEDCICKLKKKGNLIQMHQSATPLKNQDPKSGYQSVVWHGATRAPDRKTFIQTLTDGTTKTWTEAIYP